LSDAEKRYPKFPSITMFLGMAMHDNNMNTEALRTVIIAMLRHFKTSDIERYKVGLEKYIKDL
jgi:hypothetical protein